MGKLQDTKSISVFLEEGGEDGGRIDGLRVVSLHRDASGTHPQMQQFSQSTSWDLAESLTSGKEYMDPGTTQEVEGKEGGGEWIGPGLQPGVGEQRPGREPHSRSIDSDRREAFEQTPVDDTHAERGIKPPLQLQLQGHSDKGRGLKTFPSAV